MDRTIGTCSECGGAVMVPEVWLGVYPPIPTCRNCGAKAKQPHGPVIPMEPNKDRYPPQGETNKVFVHEVKPDDPNPMFSQDQARGSSLDQLKRDDYDIAMYEARVKGGG